MTFKNKGLSLNYAPVNNALLLNDSMPDKISQLFFTYLHGQLSNTLT